jgi:amidohydrolase
MRTRLILALMVVLTSLSAGAAQDLSGQIEARIPGVMPKVIAWRRDIHQHPELSNREVRTARFVADHPRARPRGHDGRWKTGVVGLLRAGCRAGGALRADMDALPVKEMLDLPFKSQERSSYNGEDVDVMHACGHDAHTAMLMGVAEILTGMKGNFPAR